MNTHSELSNLIFLDRSFEKVVAQIHQAHTKQFAFAWLLNELAHKALFDAKINRQDPQHLLLATLEHRALTSYQSVVLLVERGLPHEARAVLRTLLEVTFRTVAIANNKDIGLAYILEDERHRIKLINKYKMLSKEVRTQASKAMLNELKSTIETKIKDQGIKKLKTQWFAQRAGLEDLYHSAYSVLSEAVHVNSKSLESALNLDDDETLVSLNYFPSDNYLDKHIYTAAEALLLSLRAVHLIIETKFAKDNDQLHKEFKSKHAVSGDGI